MQLFWHMLILNCLNMKPLSNSWASQLRDSNYDVVLHIHVHKQLFKIFLRSVMLSMWYDYKNIVQNWLNVLCKNIWRKISKSFYTGNILLYCPGVLYGTPKLILLLWLLLKWMMWPMGVLFVSCYTCILKLD